MTRAQGLSANGGIDLQFQTQLGRLTAQLLTAQFLPPFGAFKRGRPAGPGKQGHDVQRLVSDRRAMFHRNSLEPRACKVGIGRQDGKIVVNMRHLGLLCASFLCLMLDPC